MRSVVIILDISLMSHSRVTREYKLHGLSELIYLDTSCIDGRMEVHVDNVMLCTYRASDYFYFMPKLKGNATYEFPS